MWDVTAAPGGTLGEEEKRVQKGGQRRAEGGKEIPSIATSMR
jgi:hypothetical protein